MSDNTRRMAAAVLTAAALALPAGCDKSDKPTSTSDRPENKGKLVVYTTFYPTTYFARRIGGDHVKVVCPLPPDENPVSWMPDAKTIEAYQKADLIVVNGAEFEKWVAKVSLPESRIVDTARSFEADFITLERAVVHTHGPGGKHAHEGLDGHTWLDPVNAAAQAGEIRKALARLAPDRADDFTAGCNALSADLAELHAALSELTKAYKGQPILCSHPAYNYIARRYKWNVKSEDLDPETMPTDKKIAAMRETLKTHRAKYILWESQPTRQIADRLKAELGLESVEFSPCESLGKEQAAAGLDYMKVMRKNIENITPVLKGEGGQELMK